MNYPAFFDAARDEALGKYNFISGADDQPKWDIPEKIGIGVAVAARFQEDSKDGANRMSIEEYVDAASAVIDAGAYSVHIDFSWATDPQGRRLDVDIPPVEAYGMVLEPLRKRFGNGFIADLNVLNGTTFERALGPVTEGLAEMAPCASGHPDAFVVPALELMNKHGVKPFIAIHNSGEVELAKRKLIDTGALKPPFHFGILIGLPFSVGRTLISSVSINDTQEMAQSLFLIVDQIRKIDPTSVITVAAAGRATIYLTTLATMMGLHIRVGTEDTPWKYPNHDTYLKDNLEMFNQAKDLAALLGRQPATANEFRTILGLPHRS